MSFLTTDKKLVGDFKVKQHAVERMRERYGEQYIGDKKIKNMSHQKIRRKIRESLRERIEFVSENDNNTVYVKTEDFEAIVEPLFKNQVITVF